MITAVDTNILIDILEGDVEFGAALRAAHAWAGYRRAGGTRRRIAADFLIGGHATCQADRLLTRDEGFHRKHFTGLQVETPGAGV